MRQRRLILGIVACLGACAAPVPPPAQSASPDVHADSQVDAGPAIDAAHQDAPHDATAAPDLAQDAEEEEPELPSGSVHGTVRGEDGQVLANQSVTCCTKTTCRYVKTDFDGVFTVANLQPPVQVAIKVQEDVFATPPRAEFVAPALVADLEPVELGTVHVPTLPDLVAVAPASSDPQTLTLSDGLQVTLRRADLTFALGAVKEEQIGGRLIPAQNLPELGLASEATVLAVYVLYPFGSTSSSPVSVRVPTSLPAGSQAKLRTVSEYDGTLSAPVAMTSDGQWLRTGPGSGVLALTWLVVSTGGK